MTGYQFRPELKGIMQRAHARVAKANPSNSVATKNHDRPAKADNADRANNVRARLVQHIARHQGTWIAAEERRLRLANLEKQTLSRSQGPRPPFGVAMHAQVRAQTLRRQAEARVQQRCETRLEAVDRMANRQHQNQSRSRRQS